MGVPKEMCLVLQKRFADKETMAKVLPDSLPYFLHLADLQSYLSLIGWGIAGVINIMRRCKLDWEEGTMDGYVI